ncbi:hypothetical protein [Tsukamurella asaccharolytica]
MIGELARTPRYQGGGSSHINAPSSCPVQPRPGRRTRESGQPAE